jgi:hypothetical protein
MNNLLVLWITGLLTLAVTVSHEPSFSTVIAVLDTFSTDTVKGNGALGGISIKAFTGNDVLSLGVILVSVSLFHLTVISQDPTSITRFNTFTLTILSLVHDETFLTEQASILTVTESAVSWAIEAMIIKADHSLITLTDEICVTSSWNLDHVISARVITTLSIFIDQT